jgi:hypothetical protein
MKKQADTSNALDLNVMRLNSRTPGAHGPWNEKKPPAEAGGPEAGDLLVTEPTVIANPCCGSRSVYSDSRCFSDEKMFVLTICSRLK